MAPGGTVGYEQIRVMGELSRSVPRAGVASATSDARRAGEVHSGAAWDLQAQGSYLGGADPPRGKGMRPESVHLLLHGRSHAPVRVPRPAGRGALHESGRR